MLSLVRFADSKVADGTMLKRRLILPGRKALVKWFMTFGRSENEDSMDSSGSNHATGDTTRTLWTDTFQGFRKDPEHMPIKSPLQNVGKFLRGVGKVLRSPHSQFGFRLACAAMSIEIVGYLRDTQIFFVEQRLFWGSIMVAVSMTRTTGEASFIYFLRLFGTFVGAVVCYIIHYIVDGHVPGVLVFYFLTVTIFGYMPVKKPKFALAAVIATVSFQVGRPRKRQLTGTGYMHYRNRLRVAGSQDRDRRSHHKQTTLSAGVPPRPISTSYHCSWNYGGILLHHFPVPDLRGF